MTSSEGEALFAEPQNDFGSEGFKAHLIASPAPGRDTFPWISQPGLAGYCCFQTFPTDPSETDR